MLFSSRRRECTPFKLSFLNSTGRNRSGNISVLALPAVGWKRKVITQRVMQICTRCRPNHCRTQAYARPWRSVTESSSATCLLNRCCQQPRLSRMNLSLLSPRPETSWIFHGPWLCGGSRSCSAVRGLAPRPLQLRPFSATALIDNIQLKVPLTFDLQSAITWSFFARFSQPRPF